MDYLLLPTKLQIPPQRQRSVRRSRLIETLEQEIPENKLTLVSAPAGYGKTSLLSQWAGASRFPVVWLSIGEEDNDFARFFRYLLTGWAETQPGVKESPLGLLLSGMAPDSQAVLASFVNFANYLERPTVFVLDDYHLIDEPSIHDALTFLIDHLPQEVHFVLACRAEPPLPLARYRARRQLLELHSEHIRFLSEEVSAFLNEVMELGLGGDEVASLESQLEGWIAGLQLVALDLGHGRAEDGRLDRGALSVSGRQRFVSDFLSEDVLSRLPDSVRLFLLQTSILGQLCSPLCDAVTGSRNSQEMLALLERENLFLVPLDDHRQWFRYHHLFADFLHEELKLRHPGEVARLQERAARWYLAHELPDRALHHAVGARNIGIALEVFDAYATVKLNAGELRLIKRWLDSLPPDWLAHYPAFGLAQAGLFFFTGSAADGARRVEEIARRLEPVASEQTRRQMAKVSAVRCAIACIFNDVAQAEVYAGRALADLPQDDSYLHLTYGALGDAYRRAGRWEEARKCYINGLDLVPGPQYRFHSVHAFGALADLELRQGRLRGAAAYWKKALAGIEEQENWGAFPLPLIGWVYIRMAEILYEWNELEEAGDYAARGLKRAELGGDVRAMIAGYLLAGRLKLSASDFETASEYLEKARPLAENAQFPDWAGRFERLQLELWLAQDMLRAAVNRADEILRGDTPQPQPEREDAHLAMARVLIVRGDAPALERAGALLARLLHDAEGEGRLGIAIDALMLHALAHRKHGDHISAMTSLERALRLAEPEGYVRLFVDLGLPAARLLQEARLRDVMPGYIDKLLAAFGGEVLSLASTKVALPEPLSARELEVLTLLAAGLTNQQIGERLVISPQTAKKHVGNICSKLGVSNRTEAAARARELDLLP